MLRIEFDKRFRRDYKRMIRRGCKRERMEEVMRLLVSGEELPRRYRDHALVNSRNYKEMRERHISPDWLLIYTIEKGLGVLRMVRTGSHADLF